jgi:hypothetical protein
MQGNQIMGFLSRWQKLMTVLGVFFILLCSYSLSAADYDYTDHLDGTCTITLYTGAGGDVECLI